MKKKQKTKKLKRATAAFKSKPRFEVEKLKVQFSSGERAERIARNAVLNTLKIRAKTDGIEFNEKGRVGPEIAWIRWLYPQLKQLENEFAAEIDAELDELRKPGAKREMLVGLIYTQILCIRATVTLLLGWEEQDGLPVPRPVSTTILPLAPLRKSAVTIR